MIGTDVKALAAVLSRCCASSKAVWSREATTLFRKAGEAKTRVAKSNNESEGYMITG